jgi:hypothetical protein
MKKKVKITKNKSVPRGTKEKLSKKPGSSNVGEYKSLPSTDFAGPSGGAAPGTFPINTKKRAKAALSYAHNAPNPKGIKNKVFKEYPSLKKPKEDK